MDIKDLDLNLLRVFSAVMRRRSVTLAADELNMTQSAISNALKRLRLHFSDALFVKTPQGMTPTMLAERVAGPLLEALDGIQKTLESVQHFDPRTSERRFRIYMSDVGQLILIPRLLRELEGTAPNLSVAVVDAPTRLARELMIDGGIDIAVGTFGDYDAGFHRQRLFTKGYMVIGRPDHPAFQGGLTLDKFLRARHAVYTPPAGSHDDFEEVLAGVCRAHGARRRVVVELAHGLGIAEVITAGDLLACVPKRLANTLVATGAVTSAEVPFASPQVEVSQFWHERMHSDEGHRWFRNLVYRTYSVM